MAQDPSSFSPMFRIDVSAEPGQTGVSQQGADANQAMVGLMRHLISLQQKQNELLEQMLQNSALAQKQRAQELQQWKDANPRLSRACRKAAESLSRVQTQFLEKLTDEVAENEDSLVDGDFMLSEFVDRFGPRLAHLNGVLQVLAQLGNGVPVQ
jgi:exonuclease VII large subunit